MNTYDSLKTQEKITWCPGCPNFMILESVKKALSELIDEKKFNKKDLCIVTDIGCNSKIYDYLNLNAIYGLHGRAVPTAEGVHLGNPKLKIFAFQGDGAAYSEGIEHFIHAFRHNFPITLIVHENQAFSLTAGQSTATSQKEFISKVKPSGEDLPPLNPIGIALAAGAKFVARCDARDILETKRILKKAAEYKGFSYIEVIQECLIFNPLNGEGNKTYKVPDNFNKERAELLAKEWDYNRKEGKIPLGILYSN